MTCPDCGRPLMCPSCDAPTVLVDAGQAAARDVSEAAGLDANAPAQTYLVVARGHHNLYEELRTLVGEDGRVKVIEDRRRDQTLLPREGRHGSPI